MPGDPVDDAIEPVRASLLGLLDAGATLAERHGYVSTHDSRVMSERAEEHRFRGAWGDEPVEGAHTWAGILLAAAETQLRTMVRIVVGEPSPFGPQTLLRSGLEMAGRSFWLADPTIDVRHRVARFQTERLYNASELRRFGRQNDLAVRIEKEVKGAAKALNFDLVPRRKSDKHGHLLERRPSSTQVYRLLLDNAEPGGLGQPLFSFLSAVDHGTIYGVLEAAMTQARSSAAEPLLAGLAVTPRRVRLLLIGATLGYSIAADRYARLNGWADQHWTSNHQNAVRAARQHLEATTFDDE